MLYDSGEIFRKQYVSNHFTQEDEDNLQENLHEAENESDYSDKAVGMMS